MRRDEEGKSVFIGGSGAVRVYLPGDWLTYGLEQLERSANAAWGKDEPVCGLPTTDFATNYSRHSQRWQNIVIFVIDIISYHLMLVVTSTPR